MTMVSPRSEQEALDESRARLGLGDDVSLPTIVQLRDAYNSVAKDLQSGDAYDQARGQDLALMLSLMDQDLRIYQQALAALIVFRSNLSIRDEDFQGHSQKQPLVYKSERGWEYTRHYRMMEPRCSELAEHSALNEVQPDQPRDNAIAEKICARLPEVCRTPLYLSIGPR